MTWLALDIGGANLKSADGLGSAAVRPFALWRHPDRLASEVAALLAQSPPASRLALTMTGELADCYAEKAEGVRSILAAVEQAAGDRRVVVYLADGRLVPPRVAADHPHLAAASNWLALADYVHRWVDALPAVLIDLGSTTADVIPLAAHGPAPVGRTDPERLVSGELVYAGVERTPLCALVATLPWQGAPCPIAAELFAATADAYLLLGDLPEQPDNLDTADGRPRTVAYAHARLARMFCADATLLSIAGAQAAAAAVRDAHLALLERALRQVAGRLAQPPQTAIISGHGEFLLRQLLERSAWPGRVISLKEKLGERVSRCAPAHALAVLAAERSPPR